jgi:hypothetical protein
MDYANIQKEETLKAQVFEDFFDEDLCTYKPNIGRRESRRRFVL